MAVPKNPLKKLRLPIHIADGTKAKLDFDYECQRGHSFGEYHVHGVVNEILCANLDPTQHRVHSGFPHPELQTPGARGRRREVDFAVETFGSQVLSLCVEVKWAGSSHCTQEKVLLDLCRLQIIKKATPETDCIFMLAGRKDNIEELFKSPIMKQGTNCLLHKSDLRGRAANRQKKNFSLLDNIDHEASLVPIIKGFDTSLPRLPDHISTRLIYSARSAHKAARFQALVWSIETIPLANGR
ncbi:hypothetical protein [Komagataeibacter europaeus]|uniref:hypothetical protein n=1 Tax=Komagataeibacter europaeus TaxID=33995 RepID=UPI0015F808DB|nr:hypothetical protein [Komagataeibacter europaeus]